MHLKMRQRFSPIPRSSSSSTTGTMSLETTVTRLLLFALLISPHVVIADGSAGKSKRDEDSSMIVTVSGKSVSLGCGFKGRLIKWTKDNTLHLPSNHRHKILPNGTLVISDAQKSDAGSYTCSAKDPSGTEKSSTRVRVIESPRLVPFDFPSDVMVGKRTKVMCSVSQGEPPITFQWFRNGSGIQGSTNGVKVETSDDYSILSMENVRMDHAGNYTCLVLNEGSRVAHSSLLRVNEPPKWSSEPLDRSTISGNEITMDCNADGNPRPSISWKKAMGDPWDLSPIFDGAHYTLLPNGSLRITDANRDVDGLYFCSATNGFGQDIGRLVRLTVNEPARFLTRMKSESINKKEAVELECSATGDSPIEVFWSKEDKVIKEAKERFLIRKTEDKTQKLTSSRLVIQGTERSDGGVYQCNATNKWGHDYSLIQLIVKEIPEKPFHLQVVNVTGTSVNLTWLEPFNGNSVISKYAVKLSDPKTNETFIESPSTFVNSSITGLRPDTSYRAEVFAQNEVGWSEASSPLFFRTDEAAPSGPPLAVVATPTGPNSIKITWKVPEERHWNGQISGFYIGYSAAGSAQEHYKVIETSKKGHQKEVDRYEAHLTNLLRSTRYSAYVKALNSRGRGPASEEVIVKTLDDVPPTAPSLQIHSSTTSSITISWNFLNSLGASGVSQFILYYKKLTANLDWKEMPITTKEMTHTIGNLECGQSYEFYMTAHNSVGKSEPSAPVIGRSQGSPPISPRQNDLFAKVTATEAVINLSAWRASECVIQEFVIRIRTKNDREWLVLTSRHSNTISNGISSRPSSSPSSTSAASASSSSLAAVSSVSLPSSSSSSSSSSQMSAPVTSGIFSPTENFFFIRNLLPQTSYELEVTARNQAGTTQAQYEFYTKTLEGVFKVKPSLADNVQKYDPNHGPPAGLITPIIVSSLILILIFLIGCVICSKDSLYATRCSRNSQRNHESDFLPNGDSKVPFQAVSLKDLSTVESHSRHTPLSVELESNESCLRGSNYARPYDIFPVNVGAIDASTLRRAAAAAVASGHDSFQVRGGVYNF